MRRARSPCSWWLIASVLRTAVAAGDHRLEQEVVDLGVALRLPDVVAPDVRAVVGDERPRTRREARVAEDRRELLDELAPRAACCG